MGRLPRFPYGGTNRIRFKGYNLSRMAPPSKMLKFCLLCFFAHCITALHKCKGKSIFQNTKLFFQDCFPSGIWGSFPNGVSFPRRTVRDSSLFPEQSIFSSDVRSGNGVISRTVYLCCGIIEFFLPLCPGGLSYRSRNWEESPGRKGQCTVESTDRRRVYARVTENYRRRSLVHWIRRAQSGWPVLYSGNRKQMVSWSTLR